MSTPYSTPSFGAPYVMGQPRLRYPIPQDPTAVFYDITFECAYVNYVTPTLGATTTWAPSAVLTIPGEVQWVDGELVRYTNVYATVPTNRFEFEPYQMRYPGAYDVNGHLIRKAFNRLLPSSVYYTYQNTTTPTAQGSAYSVPFAPYVGNTASYNYVDYVQDNAFLLLGTTPSYSAYTNYVANGVSIIAEGLQYTRYAGNIWQFWFRIIPAQ